MLHLIMVSHPEEVEAGPSGVPADEILALLGLNMSDSKKEDPPNPEVDEPSSTCEEVLGDSDDYEVCQEVLDRFDVNVRFKPSSLNKVVVVPWMILEAPLTLTPPTWSIVRVVVWAFANVISRPGYVKRGTLWRTTTLSVPCKTG